MSREYGIVEQTIYKWKKNNTPVAGSSMTTAQIKQMEKKWLVCVRRTKYAVNT
ncbi:hypothetical protein [Enterococcus avium]|uniref:hypothetical protein n=1 Tax=Enterococcus TaxID=1350 RepID=UPI0033985515